MNLRVTGVGKERPFLVGAIGCGDVAPARVGREIENISIATGREDYGIARVRFDSPGNQTPRDNSLGVPVDQNEIEHLRLRKHFDVPRRDLATKRLIGAQEKLLPGLPPRIESPRDLRSAKRTVGQQSTVFPRKWHTLLDAVIDDQIADFGEAINIRLPRAKIATLDRVVKETVNAVAVVLIIFCGIDSALGSDAVGAARAVLITEAFYMVAEFAQRGCRRSAGQAASD